MSTKQVLPIPHNEFSERFALQASLHRAWYDEIAIALPEPEMFHVPRHRNTYSAIRNLRAASRGVDAETLRVELTRMGVMGEAGLDRAFLQGLFDDLTAEIENYDSHAQEVREQWMKRSALRVGQKLQCAAVDPMTDAHALVDEAQEEICGITERSMLARTESIVEVGTQAESLLIAQMERARTTAEGEYRITGIPTGLWRLDRVIGGYQAPVYVVIGARTSIGKTALMLSNCLAALEVGRAVAIYTWEMSAKKLMLRLAAMRERIDSQCVLRGELTAEEGGRIQASIRWLEKQRLAIINARGWGVHELRASVRAKKRSMGVDLVGVDQISLMEASPKMLRESRERQLADISKHCFSLSGEQEVALLILAQINREAERQAGHRPQLYHLKEAGRLEEDADIVLLINRPEFYGETCWDIAEPEYSCLGQAEIIVAKNRDGDTRPEGIKVTYVKEYAHFTNIDPDPHAPQNLQERESYGGW